jgi:hypothetical protein
MKRLSLAVIASSGQAARRAMPFALLENSQTPLIWKGKLSHEWSARPDNVKAGSWCPSARSDALLQFWSCSIWPSNEAGSASLSYVNSQTKLLWRCASGHQWEATPGSIHESRTMVPTLRQGGSTVSGSDESVCDRAQRALSFRSIDQCRFAVALEM